MFYCTDSAQICQCGIMSYIHSAALLFVRSILYLTPLLGVCKIESYRHYMDRANCFHIVLKISIKQRVNLDKGHLLYNKKNYFCFIDKNSKMIYNPY